MKLNDLLPPILIKIIKRHREYESYNEALSDCTTDAYKNVELCNMIAEKTKIYSMKLTDRPYLLNPTNVFLLSAINQYISVHSVDSIKILDFGGACGAHYFEMRRFIPERIKIKWLVVETSQMVLAAQNMKLDNDELTFYDSLELINIPIDIIHSSGALQYVPEPYEYLSKLLNFNAKWIFFNRMIFNEGNRDIITVQKSKLSANGPGPLPEKYKDRIVSYPLTAMSFQKFSNKLSEKYCAEWIFEETSGSYNINNERIVGRGLLYTKVNGNGL
jgi:putative methyltransferase (TIGR04325 family)